MAVNYKIKEVFKKTGFTLMAFAAARGVAFQSLSRKINHGKWTVDQLFELARITGCQFRCCFVFRDGTHLYLHDSEKEGDVIMPTDYNELLYEKVQAEYNAFIEELKTLPPEQIIEKSYQKTIKEDLVVICRETDRPQSEAKALYLLKYPLEEIYQEWLETDVSYMDMLRDSVDERGKSAVKEMKEKQRESR